MTVDYRAFIEDNFLILDKEGKQQSFILNDVQSAYLTTLQSEKPDLAGVRENILKARQQGFSTLIDAIFTVDFILSGLGKLPVITGQIISHKEAETRILFRRVDFFLSSWMRKHDIERKGFLKSDGDSYLETHAGSELFIGTAGAKTLGRGGTLQNLHWSEIGFYPNTQVMNATEIVPPAEQQVADGIGKIFRESTGNRMYDLFYDEYWAGKEGKGDFRSRFFPWWLTASYRREPPTGYVPDEEHQALMAKHGLSLEQVYWHEMKIRKPKDNDTLKARREYPSSDLEAFLAAGEQYFNAQALQAFKANFVRDPLPIGNAIT